jgi:putative glycosyltransferase (TIGR04348 family)
MRIGIITPAPPESLYGNRITAQRWAKILRGLGNRVSISQAYDGEPFDLLIALHARRSHRSIMTFRRDCPGAPIVLALTGTDLYRDIKANAQARRSLDIAHRIVVLQPKAFKELRPSLRDKTRLIYQSVEDIRESTKGRQRFSGIFNACVIGHLRAVKDPFRAAMAARLLPGSSHVRMLQVGGAMTDAMAGRALKEMRLNQRYEWLGEQPRSRVQLILAKSQLCVLSSRMEGGANVLSEAVVNSVPILASRIPGNVGILGEDYPGYFGVGDTKGLARLLTRAETSPEYLADLATRVCKLAPVFSPAREKQSWADLICELFG